MKMRVAATRLSSRVSRGSRAEANWSRCRGGPMSSAQANGPSRRRRWNWSFERSSRTFRGSSQIFRFVTGAKAKLSPLSRVTFLASTRRRKVSHTLLFQPSSRRLQKQNTPLTFSSYVICAQSDCAIKKAAEIRDMQSKGRRAGTCWEGID